MLVNQQRNSMAWVLVWPNCTHVGVALIALFKDLQWKCKCKRHSNVSKPTPFLDGVGVGLAKCHTCGCGFDCSVHDGMDDIPNTRVQSSLHLLS